MNKIIAVEDNLSQFKDYFAAQGCQVTDIETAMNQQVDAVVLSGSDENLMNIQDIIVNAPVINASGQTPTQVWEQLQKPLA